MKRAYTLTTCLAMIIFVACGQETTKESMKSNKNEDIEKIVKSDEEWKAELDSETYCITREKGTERAFTGKYYKHKEKGTYHCSNCDNPLFDSETKYESGSGWPSFYNVHAENSVEMVRDVSFGMVRTEVVCKRCDAHLGHVFEDGPQPTGLRYCVNSPSLNFKKAEEEK